MALFLNSSDWRDIPIAVKTRKNIKKLILKNAIETTYLCYRSVTIPTYL